MASAARGRQAGRRGPARGPARSGHCSPATGSYALGAKQESRLVHPHAQQTFLTRLESEPRRQPRSF